MKQNYEVIWSEVAENDLIQIVEYIAINDLSNALKVLKKIKERVALLTTAPQRGRIVPELKDHGILQYRELIIKPWRVVYRISNQDVYVLVVLDARQNVEEILLKRLVNSKK